MGGTANRPFFLDLFKNRMNKYKNIFRSSIMKSILIDEDIHYLLKCIVLKNRSNIKYTIHEAVIDIAKKYEISIPLNLLTYEVKHE